MKAAVFSDTHGSTALMLEAIGQVRPDIIIHLGDCERDTECIEREFPRIPLYRVCGNCDFCHTAPDEDIVPMGPVKAFICHGHLFNVKYRGVDSLLYAAQEKGAQIALFGHTHEAMNVEIGGVKIINPGTAGKGRNLSYALIEVFPNGGIASEIRAL